MCCRLVAAWTIDPALARYGSRGGRPYLEPMADPVAQNPDPDRPRPPQLRRLFPAGAPASAEEIVSGFGLDRSEGLGPAHPTARPANRPRVILNMVSTADGHATLGGRSGPLSGPADRALFHALRLAVDAVMAGAATVRVERYGRIIPDESRRRLRVERGLSEEPLACIVSGRLALEGDIPLLADPAARVVILTSSSASLPAGAPSAAGAAGAAGAKVEYIRTARDGRLDLAAALAELRARFDVHTLLCEGGPHLNAQLLEAGLVDELFLSLSPLLAGGDFDGNPAHPNPAHPEALRILAGPELSPPVALELRGVLEHDSGLFLRYSVAGLAPAGDN
jgi:riboflavin biosynthesis pyrimidine reductase